MSKSVLIVDDSRIVLDINSFIISSAGYEVQTAQNGMEALEVLTGNRIDLAIVDINMPGMDGYSLIREIRSSRATRSIPIVILTTESEAMDREKGFEAGADVYMIKPVQPGEMIAQINLLIGNP